jgi:hypothetical protein
MCFLTSESPRTDRGNYSMPRGSLSVASVFSGRPTAFLPGRSPLALPLVPPQLLTRFFITPARVSEPPAFQKQHTRVSGTEVSDAPLLEEGPIDAFGRPTPNPPPP